MIDINPAGFLQNAMLRVKRFGIQRHKQKAPKQQRFSAL